MQLTVAEQLEPEKPPEEQQEEEEEGDPNSWDEEALSSMNVRGHTRRFMGAPPSGAGMRPTPVAMAMPAMEGVGAPRMARMAVAAAPCAAFAAAACAAPSPRAIGLTAGGAQDAANFRQGIEGGHLPLPSDVTFEGLASEYYFDTRASGMAPAPHSELFAPAFSLALAPDPLLAAPAATAGAGADAGAGGRGSAGAGPASGPGPELFLAVGLDSGITDFQRPRLNLVLLLDVSGSMDAPFDRYYYSSPRPGAAQSGGAGAEQGGRPVTKLDAAKEVLCAVLDRLQPKDSVAISLFSDGACTPKRLGRWCAADAAGIKAGICRLATMGGTNFQAGLDAAIGLLRRYPPCIDGDPASTENRVVVLTDAQANSGEIGEEGLLARLKAAAADRIHCTLVGLGVDFQTELAEKVLKCRGASYFSVHSPAEFKRRLDEEFEFMVAPLVFDLQLKVLGQQEGAEGLGAGTGAGGASGGRGWRLTHVYGSPDAEERRLSGDGTVMRVHSLFPSPKSEEEGVKGGVVLLRLQAPAGTADLGAAPPLHLEARYVDRSGLQHSTQRAVHVPPEAADVAADAAEGPSSFYASSGVRKAVALARLSDALQCWLVDEWARVRSGASADVGPDAWDAAAVAGAGSRPVQPGQLQPQPLQQPAAPLPEPRLCCGAQLLPPPLPEVRARASLSTWERRSQPLAVNPQARAAFGQLAAWLAGEVEALGDASMQQEVALLRKLCGG